MFAPELQEKHITQRKIHEGVADLKKLAREVGVKTTNIGWFECQAEQLVAMRIDHELERDHVAISRASCISSEHL
jgi:hypothetical protein